MASHRTHRPLLIRPLRSRHLVGLIFGLHAGTLAIIAALPLTWLERLGLAAVILASLSYQVAAQVCRCLPWAIREAIWNADGSWTVRLRDGNELEAQLQGSTFASVGLIVLNLRGGRFRLLSIPLFPDSLDPTDGRRLRTRLRLRAPALADGGGAGAPYSMDKRS